MGKFSSNFIVMHTTLTSFFFFFFFAFYVTIHTAIVQVHSDLSFSRYCTQSCLTIMAAVFVARKLLKKKKKLIN